MGNILIVDDELDICSILTQQLQKLGFRTSYCLTIQDALSRVSQADYDLIFVDLNLTDGSGYDLINSLQQQDRPLKIVVISAYDSERQRALKSGAHHFVPKPFTKKSIEGVLRRLNFLES